MCHGVFGGGVSACRGLNEQLRGCRHSRGPVHRICGGRWRISAATLGNFLREQILGDVRQFLTSNRPLIEVRVNSKQDASFTWSALSRPSDSLKAVKTVARVRGSASPCARTHCGCGRSRRPPSTRAHQRMPERHPQLGQRAMGIAGRAVRSIEVIRRWL